MGESQGVRILKYMMLTVRICFAVLSATIIAATISVTTASAATSDSYSQELDGAVVTDNLGDNFYGCSLIYSDVVNSYLVALDDGGYQRVEGIDDEYVLVETYSSSWVLESTIEVEVELEEFGGFFSGEDYNFIVFAQDNDEEDDEAEVYCIVKYDKDWNRLGACSVSDTNAYDALNSGSLRMTEADGVLYVHTSRTGYATSSGTHHQSSLTLGVVESSMELIEFNSTLLVSHSFDQYITTDGETLYFLDLSDAYVAGSLMRGVALQAAGVDEDFSTLSSGNVTRFLLMEAEGTAGDNYTGIQVGGIVADDGTVLVTGAAIDTTDASNYGDDYDFYELQNAFVTVVSMDTESWTTIWLTDYTEDDGLVAISAPQIVALGDGSFLLMWSEHFDYDIKGERDVAMCVIDADGNLVSGITRASAALSDCQPILLDTGEVAWYVSDGESVTLYTVDPSDLPSDAELEVNSYDVSDATVTVSYTTMTYTGSALTPSVTVVNNVGRALTEGDDYTVAYTDNVDVGTATVTVTGCGSYSGTATATFTISRQALSSGNVVLEYSSATYTGSALTPSVTVTDSAGTTLTEGTDYTVAYFNNFVAGTASVVVSGIGNYKSSVVLTFTITEAESDDTDTEDSGTTDGDTDMEDSGTTDGDTDTEDSDNAGGTEDSVSYDISDCTVTLSYTTTTYTGSACKPTVTVVNSAGGTLTSGTDYSVSYSSNTSVGTATVKVTGAGNYTGTVSKTFQITAQSLSSSNVTLSYTTTTYTGSAKKPTVTVVNSAGDTLTSGTDYTVSYASGRKAVGTYKVTVTGCGNYTGTVSKTFQITAQSLSSSYCSLSATSLTYSGSSRTPTVTVKNSSGTKLTKGTDYTLSYSKSTRKAVGSYTITIKGKGNYTGTVKLTYKIVPKTVTVKSVKSSAKKKATVKWTKLASANVTKYQIRYRVKGTSTWKTVTVSSSKSSYTLTGLTSSKTYQVQVRAYKTVSGTKYYGSWSSVKTVKVK